MLYSLVQLDVLVARIRRVIVMAQRSCDRDAPCTPDSSPLPAFMPLRPDLAEQLRSTKPFPVAHKNSFENTSSNIYQLLSSLQIRPLDPSWPKRDMYLWE
jgi:hypothetical protein